MNGSQEENLRLLLFVTQKWPQDPAAFANAANIFVQAGRWDAARRVLARAPKSFHHLAMAPALIRQVAAQNIKAATPPATSPPFYGQPDIGGLVKRPSPLRRAFLQTLPRSY